MTNNFDENEHEHDPNHDEFNEPENGSHDGRRGIGGNLAEAWRTRPMFKFLVLIVAVFAVCVAGFSFFGGNGSTDVSHLGRPPAMKEAPGGAASSYMRQQTELANKENANQALSSGGSAIPTPIGQNSDVGGFGGQEKKDDTLNELRAETEHLKQQVQQQQVQQQQVQQQMQQQQQVQKPAEPFDNSLAEAMQNQMKGLLDSWKPRGITNIQVQDATRVKEDEEKAAKAAQQASADSSVIGSQSVANAKIVVNAGTVNYAQLLTEANSDVPGPILAQIVSGPLTGARAVGTFKVSAGYEKYLVLQFYLADQKGKDYTINAIALDPNTTLGGMATEVDERYFVRVVLPAAAGFLQGFGSSLGEGSGSIVTNGDTTATTIASNGTKQGIYSGLGQAASTMSQFFQNQANLTKPLVRVAAGTPIGFFFIQPVLEPNGNDAAVAAAAPNGVPGAIPVNANGMPGAGGVNPYGVPGYGANPYAAGGGYPGTNVSGYGSSGANSVPYPNYANTGSGYNPGLGGGSTLGRGFGGYSNAPVQNFGQ